MTKVICRGMDCVHNDNYSCTRGDITLDDDCLHFEDYAYSPEYQQPFWKAMDATKTGITAKHRQPAKGKWYQFGGLVFYIEQNDRHGTDNIVFTEERTGLGFMGRHLHSPEAFETFCEKGINIPDVLTLPEARMVYGKWKLVEA